MAVSSKQNLIMQFPGSRYDALICDGAIRSGKTSIMSMTFVFWAMERFEGCAFAMCGKSVGAVERNVLRPLLDVQWLRKRYTMQYTRGDHVLTVSRGSRTNRFYLFGGRDESSYALIQGVTLAGVLLDEVALMPRSFVEQAMARCSVEGSKFWFNCNPENPMHWFKREWIDKAKEKNALHIHFLMDDNPGLSEAKKEQYRRTYSGVFYDRYILGLWRVAEGVIYDMYDEAKHVYKAGEQPKDMEWVSTRTIAIDYGTTNPCVFLDIYDTGEVIRVHREYRWDSRAEHRQKTDKEYGDDFMAFMGKQHCTVIVDPSAASFIAELRSRGVYVIEACNDVLDGIRKVGALLQQRKIMICDSCTGLREEMQAYHWDDKAAAGGVEKPTKETDHGADALRYFINSLPDWRFE